MNYDEFDELDELELEPDSWQELQKAEKTAFVALLVRQGETEAEIQASLEEMSRLADTAGIEVLGTYSQKRNQPERGTFFGKGFLEELSQKMLQAQAEMLIVNEELSPMQGRNIERDYSIKFIDRTEVILSIFHDHARTKEAKLQVKLAELEYQLPRLKKLWGISTRSGAAYAVPAALLPAGWAKNRLRLINASSKCRSSASTKPSGKSPTIS
jgi:GTP-binding protein HflX